MTRRFWRQASSSLHYDSLRSLHYDSSSSLHYDFITPRGHLPQVMINALRAMGAGPFSWEEKGKLLRLTGLGGKFKVPKLPMYLGNAGTAARFLTTCVIRRMTCAIRRMTCAIRRMTCANRRMTCAIRRMTCVSFTDAPLSFTRPASHPFSPATSV